MGVHLRLFAVTLVFSIFAYFFLVVNSSPFSSDGIRIVTAERRVDLTSHIVNVFLTLKFQNIGTTAASNILLAFPPAQADHLALLLAKASVGKRRNKTYDPLTVNPTEQPDAPKEAKYFSVSLLKPLTSGETLTLEIFYTLTRSLEPFPAEISQKETQLVYYRESAFIFSPYHINQQTTYIKAPTSRFESFTRVEPTKHVNREITYGPYDNRPAHSLSNVIIHFENNNPFPVVEELVREIEISHWGSIQVTEHYKIVNGGARHKGVFSRLEYQSRAPFKQDNHPALKRLLVKLPPKVHSVYYRDGIGNISSSNLRTNFQKSELEIEPRYPLFGGWKASFVIGYALPLEDFLFESPLPGKRYLNFTFGCPLSDAVVDKLVIKVVLPEGSKSPHAVVPFHVQQRLETKYSYLDIVGRTVLVLEKENVVPGHNSPSQVYYNFSRVLMVAEPLMMVSVFLLLFVASIAYLHTDLSIPNS